MTTSAKDRPVRSSSFHVLTTTAGNLVGPLSTLLCAPILAYQLGVAGRGELAAATMPLVLLSAALTLGLPEAITHRLGKTVGDSRTALAGAALCLLLMGLIAALALLGLSGYLSGGSRTVMDLVQLSAVAAVPTLLLWSLRGVAQGLQQWTTLNFEKAATGVSRLVGIAGLALIQNLNVQTAFIVLVSAPLVGYVAYIRLFIHLPKSASDSSLSHQVRAMTTFGSRVWLGSIAGILITRLDQVLILPLSSSEQLGFYAAAVNVGDIPFFLTAAFGSILLAKESRASSNDRVAFSSRVLVILVLGLTSAAAISIPVWFTPLFGPSFEDAIPTSLVLLLAGLASAPGTVAGAALTGRGHAHDRSLALLAGLLINVAFLLLLVPQMGSLGASLATLGGTFTVTSIGLMQVKRRLDISVASMVFIRPSDIARIVNELSRKKS
ncbi:polysaccharide biosynthesis C-terminal domain-containing protein [Micrococcaceae bacterium Sec5.1]